MVGGSGTSSCGIERIRKQRKRDVPQSFIKSFPGFAHAIVCKCMSGMAINPFVSPDHTLSQFHGQLTAIAREFNFPSTSGLCIYLQLTEGDITMTPRVTDESWTILWSSMFEDRQQTGLPIAGRIEFDIDVRKARWFDAWVAASRRENEIGASAPPSVGLSSHRRDDSRTSYLQEQQEDVPDEISYITTQRPSIVPTARHIPRRLSLLDRADTTSLRGSVRGGYQPTTPARDDATATATARVLSPVMQEDEPRTAKRVNDIEKKVQSWRAVSNPSRPALSSTGQTALDPVNIPNTVPLPELNDSGNENELNLDDFTWSISSLGPPSPAESESSWDRVASVHMDRRGAGSVVLTPSTCTSIGPLDYNVYSPVSSVSRLPSPDIAARNIDSAPISPMTATSWGAPLELPSPTTINYLAPSVDVAARHVFSRPVSPATATSWGPPVVFPPSPTEQSRVHTPGLGLRLFDDTDDESRAAYNVNEWRSGVHDATWKYVWPYRGSEPEEGASWKYVWPYYDGHHSPAPEVQSPRRERANSVVEGKPWRHVWPYQDVGSTEGRRGEPWRYVWPYRNDTAPSDYADGDQPQSSRPWKHVWPYHEPSTQPQTAGPWKHVWPYHELSTQPQTARPWKQVWPYRQVSPDMLGSPPAPVVNARQLSPAAATQSWKYVWPYRQADLAASPSPRRRAFTVSHAWRHVWPYNQPQTDRSPGPVANKASSGEHRGYPYIDICESTSSV